MINISQIVYSEIYIRVEYIIVSNKAKIIEIGKFLFELWVNNWSYNLTLIGLFATNFILKSDHVHLLKTYRFYDRSAISICYCNLTVISLFEFNKSIASDDKINHIKM